LRHGWSSTASSLCRGFRSVIVISSITIVPQAALPQVLSVIELFAWCLAQGVVFDHVRNAADVCTMGM